MEICLNILRSLSDEAGYLIEMISDLFFNNSSYVEAEESDFKFLVFQISLLLYVLHAVCRMRAPSIRHAATPRPNEMPVSVSRIPSFAGSSII